MVTRINGILFGVNRSDVLGGAERTALEIWQIWAHTEDTTMRVLTEANGQAAGLRFGFDCPYDVSGPRAARPLRSRLELLRRALWGARAALRQPADITMTSSMYFFDVLPAAAAKLFRRTKRLAVRIPHFILPPANRSGKRSTNMVAFLEQRIMFEIALRTADYFLVDNDDIIAQLARRGVDHKRIKIAQVGLKRHIIEPVPLNVAVDAIYVGRRSFTKGTVDLLEAWRIVVRRFPKATLVLAGYDEVGFNTEELIDRCGVRDNVRLLSDLTDGNIEYLLQHAKFFVMPSKEEGFGRVILEALAANVPCITHGIPAFRQAFPFGRQETSSQDAEGLAGACIDLLENPDRVDTLRRDISASFAFTDWEHIAADLLAYLRAA